MVNEVMSRQRAYDLQTKEIGYSEFWDIEMETMSRDKLLRLKEDKLQKIIEQAYQTPFYQRKFKEAGVSPSDIRTIEDLKKLPITTKDDIRKSQAEHPPYGDYLTVPLKQISGLYSSSGSTGQPTTSLLTFRDQEVVTERSARSYWAFGIRPEDVVQNIINPQLFLGYWFVHWGATRIGCSVISMGIGSSDRQLQVMQRYGVTCAFMTPSYAFHLAEFASKKGIHVRKDLNLQYIVLSGEPGGSDPVIRSRIEETWGVKVFDCPGMMEAMGWGYTCKEQKGVHMQEDHFIWEVLDPETKEPVQPGERGVLVLTTLETDAQPLIRWWTDDYVLYSEDYCPCGRTSHVFPGGILSRSDDMLKISGVRVWPSGIESALKEVNGFGGEFRIVKDSSSIRKETGALFKLKLQVECRSETDAVDFIKNVKDKIKAKFNITPEVELVAVNSLDRFEFKAKRIITK
ncbi:phenylacetate--CoA ligase family protein [Pueribacillus theae]|nr:AMP-binding protein [Pueribacillus theae]